MRRRWQIVLALYVVANVTATVVLFTTVWEFDGWGIFWTVYTGVQIAVAAVLIVRDRFARRLAKPSYS